MPSIFGPTPEISLRSSSSAGFAMPAGRFLSLERRLGWLDGLAGSADRRFLDSGALLAALAQPWLSDRCAVSKPFRLRAALLALAAECRGALTLAAFSVSGATFAGGRRLQRRAGLGRIGLRLGRLSTARPGRPAPVRRSRRRRDIAAGQRLRPCAALASLSRVVFRIAFSSCSVVRPVIGSEMMRPICGPGVTAGALAGVEERR